MQCLWLLLDENDLTQTFDVASQSTDENEAGHQSNLVGRSITLDVCQDCVWSLLRPKGFQFLVVLTNLCHFLVGKLNQMYSHFRPVLFEAKLLKSNEFSFYLNTDSNRPSALLWGGVDKEPSGLEQWKKTCLVGFFFGMIILPSYMGIIS